MNNSKLPDMCRIGSQRDEVSNFVFATTYGRRELRNQVLCPVQFDFSTAVIFSLARIPSKSFISLMPPVDKPCAPFLDQ